MDETTAVNKTSAKGKLQARLLNLAGLLLIVGAAVLYWRDMKTNKMQADAANIVRMCASTPLAAMGLMLDSTGTARNAYMLCPPAVATNIVAMLMKAEPTHFPKGMVEGDEYQIFMMFTNRTHTLMRAVRLYDEPENLYVGIQQPVKFNEDKKPIAWEYTHPAVVMNLGKLFTKLAEENVPQLRKRAPEFEAAMTNIVNRSAMTNIADRAAQENARAEGDENAEPAAGPITEWMNATNAPDNKAEQPL